MYEENDISRTKSYFRIGPMLTALDEPIMRILSLCITISISYSLAMLIALGEPDTSWCSCTRAQKWQQITVIQSLINDPSIPFISRIFPRMLANVNRFKIGQSRQDLKLQNKWAATWDNRIFCICENKDADQFRSNRETDQRLWFSIL